MVINIKYHREITMNKQFKIILLINLLLCSQAFAQITSTENISSSTGGIFTNDLSVASLPGVFIQSGSIGDINNDGIGDYAQSAFVFDGVNNDTGQILIVFGSSSGYSSPLNFSEINGTKGFRITDNSGLFNIWLDMGKAGDLNGDGIDDMVLTHSQGNPPNERVAVVIYGKTNFPDSFDLSNIDGTNGFIITDSTALNSPSNRMFVNAQNVDLNCDGFNDLALGAPFAGIDLKPGTAFVIYGNGGFTNPTFSLDSLNGTNGTNIIAANNAIDFGNALSGVGDFNGDGCDDFAIGDLNAPSADASAVGRVQIVFGAANLSHPFNTENLNGSNGLSIISADAPNATNGLGTSIGGGDFNGDGFSDVIIGASGSTGSMDNTTPAHVVIINGATSNSAQITASYQGGSRVNTLRGFAENDTSNPGLVAVNLATGDINGDGLTDILIDAVGATHDSINLPGVGLIDVVYGKQGGLGNQFMLPDIENNSELGFIIAGSTKNTGIGGGLSTTDMNGDGVDDIVMAGDGADFPIESRIGAFFLLYGVLKDPVFNNGFE